MDIFLAIAAVIMLLVGIVGCILPVLPGPPISGIALLLVKFTRWGSDISLTCLGIFFVLIIVVSVLDYYTPIWGAKKFGGGKGGIYGTTIGIVVGLFFVPWGMIICPFLGALAGELISGKSGAQSLRAAFGAALGFMLGSGLKLLVSIWITAYTVSRFF
jgi:uncharacterized protein YqgC (DUF456 family)